MLLLLHTTTTAPTLCMYYYTHRNAGPESRRREHRSKPLYPAAGTPRAGARRVGLESAGALCAWRVEVEGVGFRLRVLGLD